MVNRLGLIHSFELVEEEGATLAQVTAAFVTIERLLGMGPIWQDIETAAMPEAARILLFDRAAAAMVTHMVDLLRVSGGLAEPARMLGELSEGVTELSNAADLLLSAEGKSQSARMCEDFVTLGAPDAVSAKVAHLYDIDGVIGLAMLSRQSGTPAPVLTNAFGDIGTRLGLDWAQQTAERMGPSDPWERLLVNGLARDFQHMRLDFLRRAAGPKKDPKAAVQSWAERQAPAIQQFRAMVGRAQVATPVTPAMLAQIASQARNLLGR
jgi:glutamate dehydrogenase